MMDWRQLRLKINGSINIAELRTICFDLEIDYEGFPEPKGAFLTEFLQYIRRKERLNDLLDLLAQEAPNYDWSVFYIDEVSSSKTLSSERRVSADTQERRNLLRIFLGTTVEDMQTFLNEMVHIDADQLDSNQKEKLRVRTLAMHQEADQLKVYFVSDPPTKKALHLMGNLVGSSFAGLVISDTFIQFEAARKTLLNALVQLDNS